MYSTENSAWHMISALEVQTIIIFIFLKIIILGFHLGKRIQNEKKKSGLTPESWWGYLPGSNQFGLLDAVFPRE